MNFENKYTWSEKLLHRIAFSSSWLQESLNDHEDKLLETIQGQEFDDRPVFITALPRAGTTILLNLLFGSGRFASHTYRDMPFVLCPLIWHRFSHRYQVDDAPRERAHGDGITVSADSPEALEEMIWMHFFKNQYKRTFIEPWPNEIGSKFQVFFRKHHKKIIYLRKGSIESGIRYASKNNLNIARLNALQHSCPSSTILIPFRDPVQHALSLRKQHLSFLETHQRDKFSMTYMKGVGHFDFGANLRPINFDNWYLNTEHKDPTLLNYWLSYWNAAYKALIRRPTENIHFVSFEKLANSPKVMLEAIALALCLQPVDTLLKQSSNLRPAKLHPVDFTQIDSALLNDVRETQQVLESQSL